MIEANEDQHEVFEEIPVEVPPQEEAAEAGIGAANYSLRGNQEESDTLTFLVALSINYLYTSIGFLKDAEKFSSFKAYMGKFLDFIQRDYPTIVRGDPQISRLRSMISQSKGKKLILI